MKQNNLQPQWRRPAMASFSLLLTLVWLLAGATQAQISPLELCACSPRVYRLTFDFSLECEPINVDLESGGITDAVCSVSAFDDIDVTDFVPVAVSSVQLIEIGQDGSPIAVDQQTGDFRDGFNISYTSVSFDGAVAPRTFQLRAVARNEAGEPIVLQWSVTYSNNCGVWPVLEVDDSIGWSIFSGLADPIELVCPAVADSSDAPLVLDPTPEPTTSSPTTNAPTVLDPTPEPTTSSIAPTRSPTTTSSNDPTRSPTPEPTTSSTIAPTLSPTTPSPSATNKPSPPNSFEEEIDSVDPEFGLAEPQSSSLDEAFLFEDEFNSDSVDRDFGLTDPQSASLDEEFLGEPEVASVDEDEELEHTSLEESSLDQEREKSQARSKFKSQYKGGKGVASEYSKGKSSSNSKNSNGSKGSSSKGKGQGQGKGKGMSSKYIKGKGGKGSSNGKGKGMSNKDGKGGKGSSNGKGKGMSSEYIKGKGGKGSSNGKGKGMSSKDINEKGGKGTHKGASKGSSASKKSRLSYSNKENMSMVANKIGSSHKASSGGKGGKGGSDKTKSAESMSRLRRAWNQGPITLMFQDIDALP